jgi:hypothetical protein
MSVTTMAECPFAVGDEVTITQGHGGNPLRISRVEKTYNTIRTSGEFRFGWRVVVEGFKCPFSADALGAVSFRRKNRYYLVPTTEEHRTLLSRAAMLESLASFRGWKGLPNDALREILKTINAYRPGV